MTETTFRVPTAFCPHCQYTLEQAVGDLAGVKTVAVDLPQQTLTVAYDPTLLEREAIRQRIEGAGFPVAP